MGSDYKVLREAMNREAGRSSRLTYGGSACNCYGQRL